MRKGKYKNLLRFYAAYWNRELLRYRLSNLVAWPKKTEANQEEGCTAIVGMCHRLPDVLLGNLNCLMAARWPELKEVIVVVDGVRGCIPRSLEQQAIALSDDDVSVRVLYYSALQAKVADRICLPYIYAWLSWSIGISECLTKNALLHDYDALVFEDSLSSRYLQFVESGASIQGIRWYKGGGIEPDDQLATTFEAFFDVSWARSRTPLAIFHKIRKVDGVSRDYDTFLDLQHNFTPIEKRTFVPIDEEKLVHPSQMIHQFTMFKRQPGDALPCFSILMIPFYSYLSGDENALCSAIDRIDQKKAKRVKLFGEDSLINFEKLQVREVDWNLKQMVLGCILTGINPFATLYEYGLRMYQLADASPEQVWKGDFTLKQQEWIATAKALYSNDEAA